MNSRSRKLGLGVLLASAFALAGCSEGNKIICEKNGRKAYTSDENATLLRLKKKKDVKNEYFSKGLMTEDEVQAAAIGYCQGGVVPD